MNLPPGPSSQLLTFTNCGVRLYHVAWTPPPEHSWKLNFAGFVADQVSGIGGAAFLIRDENALFVTGWAAPLRHVKNIVLAELVALINGLHIAVHTGVEYLEIEGDCNAVFQLLDGQVSGVPSIFEELVGECVKLLRSFRSVSLHPVNCLSNEAANRLAVLAARESEPHYWSAQPPNAITGILVEDVIGRWVPVSIV